MPNHLEGATSPYLLQHKDNPVEWYQWGEAAFSEAAARDVPILLSVGYASCHWCHVMAHESFEDEAIATLMNRLFVNVKVDREERPDVDRVYMDAVQTMTGQGGWPMTVFLTPDRRPFFAGTYFPPEDRAGHPSFRRVMEAVHDAWSTRRDDVERQAAQLTQAVATPASTVQRLDSGVLATAYQHVAAAFDRRHGGFGGAPKFPQAPTLEFLLRAAGEPWAPDAAEMLDASLSVMARGGLHDLLGGGFARYTVDDRWLVPHFEKMLYDNAQLARIYALGSMVTDTPAFAEVARTTVGYLVRDLGLPEGGFASSEDADSEGEEGRFYVFSWEEIREVSDDDAVAEVLGASPEGNFEGRTILHRARTVAEVATEHGIEPQDLEAELTRALQGLRARRAQRIRPALDDKVVCAWNGLAIRALADAGRVLAEPEFVDRAATCARFVLSHMRNDQGRLMRSWRAGRASGPGFCDDYAALALGLFALYAATADSSWYLAAEQTTRAMIDLFWDAENGGFFATGSDAEMLITRPKNVFDNPTPSDNALAAEAVQHLAAYTAEPALRETIDSTLRAGATLAERYPLGAGHTLAVLLVEANPPLEVAIVGPDESQRHSLEEVLDQRYRPAVFRAVGDGSAAAGVPLLDGRTPVDGAAAAYVCRGFVCDAPVTSAGDLAAALDRPTQSQQ